MEPTDPRRDHQIAPEDVLVETRGVQADFFFRGGGMEAAVPHLAIIILFVLASFGLLSVVLLPMLLKAPQELKSLARAADENPIKEYLHDAPRGMIYDRTGEPLALNDRRSRLVIQRRDLPQNSVDTENLLANLAKATGKTPDTLRASIENASSSVTDIEIEPDMDIARASLVSSALHGIVGPRIEHTYARRYLNGAGLASLIGYVSRVNRDELETSATLRPTDVTGKAGLERFYDLELRGAPGGDFFETTAIGEVIRQVESRSPIAGKDLKLTIDLKLQRALLFAVNQKLRALGASRGGAVALEPNTGAILALVSLPTYEPTDLTSALENPESPLFNRVVSGVYPIGSTFKLVVALAALQENAIDPLKKIYAPGAITVTSEYNPNLTYTFHDWREHGWINMVEALARSSNVYFYALAGGYKDIKGIGVERLKARALEFGFGALTGIDLPNEAAGLMPDPAWKLATKGERWYIGDTYHLAIGQGDIGVTPIQLARYTAFLASRGALVTPHLNNERDWPREALKVDPAFFDIVRRGMHESAYFTTGTQMLEVGVPIAGKTGTAQTGRGKSTHSWYTAFAPVKDPKIVVTAFVEEGGEGAHAAQPIVKDFLKYYFKTTRY